MPNKIISFTVNISNPKTDLMKLDEDLDRMIGRKNYRRFRNYNRPSNECVAEVTFYGPPSNHHFLFSLVHPYVQYDEEIEEWHEVSQDQFSNLFEEAA